LMACCFPEKPAVQQTAPLLRFLDLLPVPGNELTNSHPARRPSGEKSRSSAHRKHSALSIDQLRMPALASTRLAHPVAPERRVSTDPGPNVLSKHSAVREELI